VLKTLLDRKLITEAGRKNVIGKPILYKTTKEFLIQFGLKDLAELPSLKEFEEIRRMALVDDDAPQTPADATPAAVAVVGGEAPSAPAGEPAADTADVTTAASSDQSVAEAAEVADPAAGETTEATPAEAVVGEAESPAEPAEDTRGSENKEE
jgi:segregation and condensation protein B